MRNWLAEGDYAQLELRIVALLAGDEPLLETFANGEDPHAKNAADIFGIPVSDVAKSQRDFAKTFVYAANYLGTAETIWKNICVEFPDAGFTLLQIDRSLRNWFKRHSAIQRWQQAALKTARQLDKVVAPISGHELFFFGNVEPNKVVNYPVQHTAADIINPVTRAVCDALDWPREGILAQCHDALLVDGPDPIRLYKILKEKMTSRVTLAGREMMFEIDVKIGRSWGNAVEIKDETKLEETIARLLKDEQDRADALVEESTRGGAANSASAKSNTASGRKKGRTAKTARSLRANRDSETTRNPRKKQKKC